MSLLNIGFSPHLGGQKALKNEKPTSFEIGSCSLAPLKGRI